MYRHTKTLGFCPRCINEFRMILSTNSRCIPVRHSLTGFYSGADCVLCEIRTACFYKRQKGGKFFPVHISIAATLALRRWGRGEWLTSRPGRFTSWKETPCPLNRRVSGWVDGRRVSVDVFPSCNSNPKHIKFSLQRVKIILY